MKHISLCCMTVAFLALGVSGCSSDPDTAAFYKSIRPFARPAPQINADFTAAREAKAPLLVAAVESNPSAISVFALQRRSDASGVGTWIGPDGTQVMMSDGILVGTRGFGADVLASDVSKGKALIRGFGSGYVTRLMTVIDGENHAVTRAFRCLIAPGETQPVNQGDREVSARTVTETCRSNGISFDNYYWVVPASGEIIQSSQWAGLATGKISFRSTPQ